MTRRTKIVATLGPATDDPVMLEAILRAGVDIARMNFSHGSVETHIARVQRFRDAAAKVGKFAAVLADLPGPKLRVKIAEARTLNTTDTIHFSLSLHVCGPVSGCCSTMGVCNSKHAASPPVGSRRGLWSAGFCNRTRGSTFRTRR
jgi:hypothetical protein